MRKFERTHSQMELDDDPGLRARILADFKAETELRDRGFEDGFAKSLRDVVRALVNGGAKSGRDSG